MTLQLLPAEVPHQNDLALWLDASADGAFVRDEKGHVKSWKNRAGKGDAVVTGKGLQVIAQGLGGKPVLRLTGHHSLKASGVLAGAQDATVFVLFRRPKELAGHKGWQKVITSGRKTEGIFLGTGKSSGEYTLRVMQGGFKSAGPDIFLGTSFADGRGELWGDVAEVLVYRRGFIVAEPINQIIAYLEKKWDFQEDRSKNWTRAGPLPETPKRITDQLPLSDQKNAAQWTSYFEMWDEFDEGQLDAGKWWDHNPTWYGRTPARYLAREVVVKDGELQITMRKDPSLKVEKFYGRSVFRDYSSGTIKSKKATLYGYFECEAQAMASSASSAWWFTGVSRDRQKNGAKHRIEIDVFELGGRSVGRENIYSMNLHIFQTPESRRHWNLGGEWEAPFQFADGFHVFGLEWTPEFIRYYVDGALVRSVANTAWHSPQFMLFDSETMNDWLGAPKDSDLPSTFRVKYVRAWKNKTTNPEWWKRYRMEGPRGNEQTPITKYIRRMDVEKK